MPESGAGFQRAILPNGGKDQPRILTAEDSRGRLSPHFGRGVERERLDPLSASKTISVCELPFTFLSWLGVPDCWRPRCCFDPLSTPSAYSSDSCQAMTPT